MRNKKELVPSIHSRGVFKVQPAKFEEFKKLVVDSQKLIEEKIIENGPITWDASYSTENNVIYIDCTFNNKEAEIFHENNIRKIVELASPLMTEPPKIFVSEVFSFIS